MTLEIKCMFFLWETFWVRMCAWECKVITSSISQLPVCTDCDREGPNTVPAPQLLPQGERACQEQRALLQTALGSKLLPETARVAGEEAGGGRWGSTQGFCFAERSAQQGTGKSTLGCPVHKLLWWLLKCLKRGSVLRQQCKLLCYARAVPLWQLQEKFMFKASPWASEQWNESHFCREWKVESRHLSG